MSRSVKPDYDAVRTLAARRPGKRALARQSAAQFARDEIAKGADPKTFLSLATNSGVQTITYEDAAGMAFVSDIIDKELERILQQ